MGTVDIIIADDEICAEAARAMADAQAAETTLGELITFLNGMRHKAFKKGNIAANFGHYADMVEEMKDKLGEMVQMENDLLINMIREVDTADSFLY